MSPGVRVRVCGTSNPKFTLLLCAAVFLTAEDLWARRIHYPLPLPYLGKPDPALLQKEVRALKAELSAVTSHGVTKSADAEIQRLRTE